MEIFHHRIFTLIATAAFAFGGAEAAELRVEPPTVKPGDPLLVTVTGVAEQPAGTVGGRPLQFYEIAGGYQAVTGLPVELTPGPLQVRVEAAVEADGSGDGGPDRQVALQAGAEVLDDPPGTRAVTLERAVEVVDPKFPQRELKVASKYVSPPKSVRQRMREDRAAFEKAQSQPFGPPLFEDNFGWPRPAQITAQFGDLRTFNGKKQSQHYGVDLDGNTGDPIWAANDGQVVMVRDCYASGNSVIVHHGAGLYTLYFHLSSFEVKLGQRVKKGDRIGKVGSTGRVTGPHLHWSVKVDGLYVDGTRLLALDFRPPARR